jgi:hypothetical protein
MVKAERGDAIQAEPGRFPWGWRTRLASWRGDAMLLAR